MLAYFCKYVPEELFQAFGTNITCMEPHVTTFTQADALMHPNMCSFSKAVLEEFEKQDYDGMIFTSCCDSSRRLYDILRHLFPDKFFFCLDLPRKINDFAVTLYTRQLEKLIDAYTVFPGKHFLKRNFWKSAGNVPQSRNVQMFLGISMHPPGNQQLLLITHQPQQFQRMTRPHLHRMANSTSPWPVPAPDPRSGS